jgi:hypothetical protein
MKAMTDDATLTELNTAIAAIRENIRELIEQAAAYSGAADQERTADRIADQEARLAAHFSKSGIPCLVNRANPSSSERRLRSEPSISLFVSFRCLDVLGFDITDD